jgi:hypothetical protein
MTKNFPSGINELEQVNLLVFQTNSFPWWLIYVIYLPTSSHPNSMLFSMLMNLFSSLSAKICFNLIGTFMQKRNLTKLAILLTSPLPSIRSGLMMLDDNKVTRIAYNSGIKTTTSCMITIVRSNRLFLLLSQQTKILMTILVCYLFLMMAV